LKHTVLLLSAAVFLLGAGAVANADPINIGSPYLPKITSYSANMSYKVKNSTTGTLTITGGAYAVVDIPGTSFIPVNYSYNLTTTINRNNPHLSTGTLTVNGRPASGTPEYNAYDDYLEYFGKFGGYPSGKLVASTKLAGFGWDGLGSTGTFEFLFNNNKTGTDWYGLDAYAYVLAPVFNLSIGGVVGDWDVNFKNKLFGINWTATSNVITWVPIPASGLLLGSGILLVGRWMKKSRRRHDLAPVV
jgi:hypothetical protein